MVMWALPYSLLEYKCVVMVRRLHCNTSGSKGKIQQCFHVQCNASFKIFYEHVYEIRSNNYRCSSFYAN